MNNLSNQKVMDAFLLLTLMCLGFYGGTGFFVIMGGNPAILKMSNATFAEYWQHTDHFMAARMKFFGPITMLCTITSVILLYKNYSTVSFVFMTATLAILVVDLIHAINSNFPLNQLIQSWDLNDLPGNVAEIKLRVVNAFWFRAAFMIASFILGLVSFWKRLV